MEQTGLAQQQTLVDTLRQSLQAQGEPVQMFETHISWVLVAGPWAYKIKKAVRFDFLDFSTLAARRHFCEEELRLNRRLAPQLYEAVVAIAGSVARPVIGGGGEPIEYAIRMHAFPQENLWSSRIERQLLTPGEVDELAQQLAAFHLAAARAPPDSCWGSPQALGQVAEDNITMLERLASGAAQAPAVARLRTWQEGSLRRLAALFEARRAAGMVRECHGDLHCGNILTLDGKVAVFDCIEFDDALRWIDIMHDVAFACMDLRQRGLGGLAARLLNGYLERTGDYEGVAVLRYYEAQCALVRTKVALLRAGQAGPDGAALWQETGALLAAALDAAHPARPALIVMHGFAGSGKSTVARRLVELFGAVQVRADVERKRMHGLEPGQRPPAGLMASLYGQQATRAVYRRLGELAAILIKADMPVVIDACCLKRHERAAFEEVAAALYVPLVMVDVRAREPVLRARIGARAGRGLELDPSDADEAVLDLQLRAAEPLTADELARTVTVDSEAAFDPGSVRQAVCRLLAARGRAGAGCG